MATRRNCDSCGEPYTAKTARSRYCSDRCKVRYSRGVVVPIETKALSGQDSLLSIVQMPAGVPVGTLAIGKAGAINAALLAAAVLALNDAALATRLAAWRKQQTDAVKERPEGSA